MPQPPANQMSSVVVSRVLAQNEGQNKQASGFPNAGYKDARPNGKMLKHPDGRACYDCGEFPMSSFYCIAMVLTFLTRGFRVAHTMATRYRWTKDTV